MSEIIIECDNNKFNTYVIKSLEDINSSELEKKILILNTEAEDIDKKITTGIEYLKNNKHLYDDKTIQLIIKALKLYRQNTANIIDKVWLKRLLNREYTFKDIENIINICRNNPFYFINNFVYVKNKFEKIEDIPPHLKDLVVDSIIKFITYSIQEEFLSNIINDKTIGAVKSRQTGGTTTAISYILWFATFNDNKEVLILSKTDEDAKKTLGEMKFMYEYLPFFLKRNVLTNNERQFVLGKKGQATSVRSLTSGKGAGRSVSATLVMIDEVEFIKDIEEIYASIVPTLSATSGKLILISTPYMYNSFFYKIVHNTNENGFKISWFYWWKIPNRDCKWYKEECKKLNYDIKAIKTELNCEWIIPYQTYIPEDKLIQISTSLMKPINVVRLGGNNYINIYEYFQSEYKYLISIDTKEFGNDYNGIVVFKIDIHNRNAYIVAEAKLDRNDFSLIDDILQILKYYPTAKILFERNRAFAYINKLVELGYKEVLLNNIKEKTITDNKENKKLTYIVEDGVYGLITFKKNRDLMFSYLNKYINENIDKISILLYEELKELVIKDRGKIEGLNHDDIIMAFNIGYYYINKMFEYNNILQYYLNNVINNRNGNNFNKHIIVSSLLSEMEEIVLDILEKEKNGIPLTEEEVVIKNTYIKQNFNVSKNLMFINEKNKYDINWDNIIKNINEEDEINNTIKKLRVF